MSLLLDALKKAAEQKAENSREPETGQESPDETELLDQTATKIASESEITGDTRPGSQIDPSESGFESRGVDEHIQVDDKTITGGHGEDETRVVSDEETLDFSGDKTQLVSDDETLEFSGDRTQLVSDDETMEHSYRADGALSGPETSDIDGPSQDSADAETIFSQSGDPDEPVDADPSVSLFEQADTQTTAEAASQIDTLPGESSLDMTPANDATKSLNLVGVPDRDDTMGDTGGLETSGTTTPGIGHYAPPGGGTSTQLDSTATRTFAPDNYDRTLHKPLNDGASSLFAGLKSDSDVVMTPEYAKKMFLNKSSSLRMQDFRIYGGTGLGILLIIVIFAAFEIDNNTTSIEGNLRPLKWDPMPGLIKIPSTETFTNVLAPEPGNKVDATTLQLVENAELIADSEEVVDIELSAKDKDLIEISNADQIETDAANTVEMKQPQLRVAKVETEPVKNINLAGGSENKSDATDNINITSKSTISEKDRWLHEAYAAYLRGDDQLALAKYNAVLDIDPDNRNALMARAAISIQNNRIAEAIGDYRRILFANPKDSLAISSMIAVANFSPEQSETQLKLLIRDEPDSHYLNFTLGNIFGAQNRWQEAQKKYFTALENNPHDPNYAYNLAVSLEHIAKPQVAIAYYELALNNYTRGLATFSKDVVDARLEILRQL